MPTALVVVAVGVERRPRAAREDHDLVISLEALSLQVLEEPEGRQHLRVHGLLRRILRLLIVAAVRPVSESGRRNVSGRQGWESRARHHLRFAVVDDGGVDGDAALVNEPPNRRLHPIDELRVVVAHPVDTARAVARPDKESSWTVDGRTDDGGDGRVDHQAARVVRYRGVVHHELAGAVLLVHVHLSTPKKARVCHQTEHFLCGAL